MFQSIWEDVKREFGYGNMVTRIIIINVAVFVLIHLVGIILYVSNGAQPSPLFRDVVNFLSMSSDWKYVLTHPWVIFTHMFLHEGFWHILWNMLFLYWFGRIVGDFIGNQRVLPIYLLGGLAGAIIYFLSANLMPYGAMGARFALGASAAVMAVVSAAAFISPDYIMRLLLLGDVKLKYIVMALVFIDLISIANDSNTGGHLAHLGGVAMGWLFVQQLRNGNDLAMPINGFFNRINSFFQSLVGQKQKPGPRMAYKNPHKQARATARKAMTVTDEEDLSYQEQLDAILDKIKQSGYDSLSEHEKEFLFNASKK